MDKQVCEYVDQLENRFMTADSNLNQKLPVISVVTDSESADSSESVRVRIRESFTAISDGFGSSVCESIFTYQVAAFKRRVWPRGRLNERSAAAADRLPATPLRCLVGHVTHLAASSNYLKR